MMTSVPGEGLAIPQTADELLELLPNTEAPTTAVGASFVPLRLQDRCIRCTAQALVRGQLPSGTQLDWCKHHFEEHGPALKEGEFEVLDDKPLRDLYTEDRKKGEL